MTTKIILILAGIVIGVGLTLLFSSKERVNNIGNKISIDTTFSSFFPTKEGNKINISILTVPHSTQRYKTPADYYWNKDGKQVIKVSEVGNWRSSFAVAVHELVESQLCINKGISIDDIDNFDMNVWKYDPTSGIEEPGADPRAPYHKEHMLCLKIEKMIIEAFGEDWKKHDSLMLKMQQ